LLRAERGRAQGAQPRSSTERETLAVVRIDLVTIVVEDYDMAIAFFVDALGFVPAEDSPAETTDGRPKRWVVVRPPDGGSGLLLAQADGEEQRAVIGRQLAGRVGFFLHVDDFDAALARLERAGAEIVRPPRTEPYGRVAVFRDVAGNRWDLIGPFVSHD
jgi:catechol 2,3-dioxygenase-like lactoylglutathione lyase family enzyme